MDLGEALLLGVIQGLCEFLPVSSSGHLALLQHFFGGGQELLGFDVLLHMATVMAVLLYFRRDIAALSTEWFCALTDAEARPKKGWRYGWCILLATFVTAVVALPLKGKVALAMQSPVAVGVALLLTASLLLCVPFVVSDKRNVKELTLTIAFFIGLAQGFAVFPGVSRSGATIVAGLCLGLTRAEAFRFSFLISVPVILGAALLEAKHFLWGAGESLLPDGWVGAVFLAFLLGYFSLCLLHRMILSRRWTVFGVYCFLLGSCAVYLGITG